MLRVTPYGTTGLQQKNGKQHLECHNCVIFKDLSSKISVFGVNFKGYFDEIITETKTSSLATKASNNNKNRVFCLSPISQSLLSLLISYLT